jgi:hypothetical protein
LRVEESSVTFKTIREVLMHVGLEATHAELPLMCVVIILKVNERLIHQDHASFLTSNIEVFSCLLCLQFKQHPGVHHPQSIRCWGTWRVIGGSHQRHILWQAWEQCQVIHWSIDWSFHRVLLQRWLRGAKSGGPLFYKIHLGPECYI